MCVSYGATAISVVGAGVSATNVFVDATDADSDPEYETDALRCAPFINDNFAH